MADGKSRLTESDSAAARKLEREVVQLAERGSLKEASVSCRKLTESYPGYASGWHTASHLSLRLRNPEAALQSIGNALSLQPGVVPWMLHRVSCLSQSGRGAEAKSAALELHNSGLSSAQHCASLAMLLSQLELMVEARLQYQRAIDLEPELGSHYYNLATVQRALGDLEAARVNLTRAVELDPRDYDAWYALSELRDPAETSNHIGRLEALLQSGIDKPKGKVQVLYALARELEDVGESDKSFQYLRQGASLRRQHLNYRVESDLDIMSRIRELFPREVFASVKDGAGDRQPIFVVGLPRTGTTLVERILGAHSQVHAAGELNDFPRAMMQMVRQLALARNSGDSLPTREGLLELTPSLDFRRLGEAYMKSAGEKAGGCAHFVDKLPLNFLYAGLIHLALPRAKIIHVQRGSMDSCYAMYKTLFRDAYPFSYDLRELGDYYLAYRELMAHWERVIPGVIHGLHYEELVGDTEAETRRLLDYCELPWEEQCLAFHQSNTPSATASAVQVRRQIYRSSVGKWRQYAGHLKPLAQQLSAAGVSLDLD